MKVELYEYARDRFYDMLMREGLSYEDACEFRTKFLEPIIRAAQVLYTCRVCGVWSREKFMQYQGSYSPNRCGACTNKHRSDVRHIREAKNLEECK